MATIAGNGHGLLQRRVPVVTQLNTVECGPACLAMILGYHGRETPISECRERCFAGRDGVSALMLAQAARSFGLQVTGYRAEPADLRHLPLPAIVHWELDHYVVVERWSPDTVDIVDPASGRRCLRAAEFEAGFSGVLMTLTPGAALEPARARPASSWARYLRAYALTAPGILAQALAAVRPVSKLGGRAARAAG
jgi:ATP-binding cassette, subfamily B, bacterial